MNKPIKDFLLLVQRANLTKEASVRLSIDDANKLHTSITELLLELKSNSGPQTRIIDGGRFK
jgi:hypothetical protein